MQLEAAAEAGLHAREVELDLYTRGFSEGIEVRDPYDAAIVARGRTILDERSLLRSLRPALQYLGVQKEAVALRVHDGTFELRIAKHAAEASNPAMDGAKQALRVWIGFGLLGLAAMQLWTTFVSAIVWGAGLLLGGWQLRKGLVSGRAMLAARLALALGMLAQEEQLILPPAEKDPRPQ